MKKTGWFFCSVLLVSTSLVYAADKEAVNTDFKEGKALHDKHCMACHTRMNKKNPNKIYTRNNRKVQSLNGLKAQVHRCDNQLDLGFFDDEIKGLVDYLNQEFYKFEKTSK
jgi:cytochrome c5